MIKSKIIYKIKLIFKGAKHFYPTAVVKQGSKIHLKSEAS
jgi:hypothetical protein